MSRYRQSFTEAWAQVEKWSKDVEVKSTGEHKDKTVAQLEKEVEALRGKPNNEKEMGGLLFAIRAKQGWKKGEGSTGVGESTQIKHEKGEQKPEKAERGERKAGESDDDYEDRESGGEKGLRPNPFKKKKKQDDLDRDDEAQATRSKIRPTAEDHNCDEVHPEVSHKDWISQKESNLPPHLSKFLDKKGNPNPEAAKRMADGKKKRAVATKVKDVTPKGYGPNEEVELEAHPDAGVSLAVRRARKKKSAAQMKKDMQHADNLIKLGAGRRKEQELRGEENVGIDELSNELLGKYKKKSAAASSAAAKAGDHDKSHKRYKGINTATTLQFRNDAKKHEEVELAIMSLDHKEPHRKLKITQKGLDALRKDRDRPKVKTQVKITKKGRAAVEDMSLAPKGKGRKAAQAMYGVKEDLEFKVTIKGIPPFYVPAKTAAAVKQSLRRQLKHPDDIESIIRVTKAAQKIDYRKRAQGKSDEDDNKK